MDQIPSLIEILSVLTINIQMQLPLTNRTNEFALVDTEIYDKIKEYKWFISNCGYPVTNMKFESEYHQVLLHRYVLQLSGTLTDKTNHFQVDHINRNKLDATVKNLRLVNNQTNQFNRQACKHSSKYMGVSWNKSKQKWRAQIMLNRKIMHIGYYVDETDAAKAYDTKKWELLRDPQAYYNLGVPISP